VTGELAPGAKLNEPELARRFGVSRGPLREAISRLEARRLVRVVPNAGARVIVLDTAELIALFETREALEGLAARLAAERMTESAIAELDLLLMAHASQIAADGGRAYYQDEGDVDFHHCIVMGADNSWLRALLLDDLYQLLRMYRFRLSIAEGRAEQALNEHRQILAAIGNRDPDLAEMLMRRHVASGRRRFEAAQTAPSETQ
jgi:DNA-binding GntR family transcriptional regulator